MDIYDLAGKKISLTQNQFVAKGGEGSIYKRGDIAYKIYDRSKDMIPLGKIQELESINHPEILRPKEVIFNAQKEPIGFTSDWADQCVVLCRIFTNTFIKANNISEGQITELVENIKLRTHFIHQNKCLIVDGNELNYLVDPDFITPRFIDVNCYQTPSYPATAIMETIRDWTNPTFNIMTDWFSFAIVSFQLFVGIHPFKGRYKDASKSIAYRIQNNLSVFHKDVATPPSVRDFSLIPVKYKDWYFKLFSQGKRELPPELPGEVIKATVQDKLIHSTDKLNITDIREYDSEILFHNPKFEITKTKTSIWVNRTDYRVTPGVEVLMAPDPIFVKIEKGFAEFKSQIPVKAINISCQEKIIIDNTLYLKNEGNLVEMDFRIMRGEILPSINRIWNIQPLSSKLFGNVIFQSLLGKSFISIPIPPGQFVTIATPDLDGYQILDGRHHNRVCMFLGHKDSKYYKIILIFDSALQKYAVRVIADVDYGSINFVTLENGVVIHILKDGQLELFVNRPDQTQITLVNDPEISMNMRLVADGIRVRFFMNSKLYGVTLKK